MSNMVKECCYNCGFMLSCSIANIEYKKHANGDDGIIALKNNTCHLFKADYDYEKKSCNGCQHQEANGSCSRKNIGKGCNRRKWY